MLTQNQVGPVATTASIAPGTLTPGRAGNLGDLIVSELHGRYYEQAYRRNVFVAANPTGVASAAFTSGTTVTTLGLYLSNPVGSTVNLVVLKVGFAFPVIDTVVNAVALVGSYNSGTNTTHTTPLVPRNAFLGVGASGQGLVDSSWTTPTAMNTLALLSSMPSATTLPGLAFADMEGSLILPPGASAGLVTLAAGAAAGFQASLMWEEVPV